MPLRLPEPGTFEHLLRPATVAVASLVRLSRFDGGHPDSQDDRKEKRRPLTSRGGSLISCMLSAVSCPLSRIVIGPQRFCNAPATAWLPSYPRVPRIPVAAQQTLKRGAFDGVMRNYRGELTGCATSYLFVVRNGTVLTLPIESGVLPSITREFLFEIGRDIQFEVRAQVLHHDGLFDADEAFLTSTTREVVPIVAVNERAIGNGKPGVVTLKLLKAFRNLARTN